MDLSVKVKILDNDYQIGIPVYSRHFHILPNFESSSRNHYNLLYNIGKEYNLLEVGEASLFINWKRLLLKCNFKSSWIFTKTVLAFPEFSYKEDALKFIELLNSHFLIYVK